MLDRLFNLKVLLLLIISMIPYFGYFVEQSITVSSCVASVLVFLVAVYEMTFAAE